MGLKILQINPTCNWGSTGVIAEDLGKLVVLKGGDSSIAYGRNANVSSSKTYRIGNKLFVLIHYFFSKCFGLHGLLSIIPTLLLVFRIRKINPDIIHLHNLHGYYLNYVILFSFLKKYNKPVVWTLHDCWAYTGHCAFYSAKGCNMWETQCNSCPNLKQYPKSLIDFSYVNYKLKKYFFTRAQNIHLVTVSRWLQNEVKRSYLRKYSISTIYNGIDIDVFKPLQIEKKRICKEHQTLILGVANKWDDRKGLNDFIQLSALLDDSYHIHLVGLSENQIHSLSSYNNISAISRTSNVNELVRLYSSADVYVNLSIEESLGMTNIESMACGTPIIVYNTTACPEVVGEGCGFIVEKYALSDIVNVLDSSIKNKKHLFSENCRRYVLSNFSKNERYEEYISLYQKICKSSF